jgi:hypothetical protein
MSPLMDLVYAIDTRRTKYCNLSEAPPHSPAFNVGNLIGTTGADIRLRRTLIFFGRLHQNFSNIECGGMGGASALWKTKFATMCLVAIFCPLLVPPALVLTHGHTISNSFLDPSTCLPLCLFACLHPCLPACLPAFPSVRRSVHCLMPRKEAREGSREKRGRTTGMGLPTWTWQRNFSNHCYGFRKVLWPGLMF